MDGCFGQRKGLWGAISGGVFLIGLGLLWYFDWWFPGILFLIGVMSLVGGLVSYSAGSRRGLWGAVSGGAFLIGLGVLWYYNWWWPGILFLIGAMIIIGGIIGYMMR
jgi:hypothetical protein